MKENEQKKRPKEKEEKREKRKGSRAGTERKRKWGRISALRQDVVAARSLARPGWPPFFWCGSHQRSPVGPKGNERGKKVHKYSKTKEKVGEKETIAKV